MPFLGDLTHAIDRMQQVSRLLTPRRRRRQREITGVLEDPFERGAGGKHARPAEHVIQGNERVTAGLTASAKATAVRRSFTRRRKACTTTVLCAEDAEPAAGLTEREQVLVADAEERPAQHADEGDAILRIAERPQQQRQLRRPPPIRPNAPAPLTSTGTCNASSASAYDARFFLFRVSTRKSPNDRRLASTSDRMKRAIRSASAAGTSALSTESGMVRV